MERQISDTQIRASVRSSLTHLRVDLQSLAIASAGGVVRITGVLVRRDTDAPPFGPTVLEDLERELRRVAGVRRVHLDPENWHRLPSGAWMRRQPALASSTRS